jgi:chromosomal replication initiator protein
VQVWADAREELRRRLPQEVLSTWIEEVQPAFLTADTLYVQAPERTREWVRRRFGGQISKAVSVAAPAVTAVEWSDGDGAVAPAAEPAPHHAVLHRDRTFNHFVLGRPNRFAHAAALAVAELPGHAYNPLFLWGPAGIGKTHLAQAIGNYVRAHDHSLSVVYATVDSFTTEWTTALRTHAVDDFKRIYRGADVLIVDDVHLLEDKPRTAEEFFHTFDHLHGRGAQLVLTSDQAPAGMTTFHDRLRGRFEAGLVVELSPPDFDMKLAILKNRTAGEDPPVDPAGLELLAQCVSPNVRTLEGALIRARAFASLTEQELSADVVGHVLSSLGTDDIREGFPSPTIDQIQEAVGDVMEVSLADLQSKKRGRHVVYARQVAMYLTRELTPLSFPTIARKFGGRDHTTVIHAHRRITKDLLSDPSTRTVVDGLVRRLGTGRTA